MSMKETRRKKTKGKKGFTLVELVIVIAVLAIIAAIAIPTVTNVINNANAAADKSNAQSIELAIKTAQSEVAANNTNTSTNATTLKNSSDMTLKFLLKTYGIDTASVGFGSGTNGADALKEGLAFHYYYNSASGKVVAAKDGDDAVKSDTGYTKLTTSMTYTISSDNTLTVGTASGS